MTLQSFAIFCGSKPGARPVYAQQAEQIGALLAQHGCTVIYGGGRNGLMGVVADTALQHGGKVYGIIPEKLVTWEAQHEQLTELVVVDDMHIRKRTIYERCDAAVILPGGFGSLDELFEILTWNQLSYHDKKIFLLNTEGFYHFLLEHMAHLAAEGFLYGHLEDQLTVLNHPEELIPFLKKDN